MRSQKKIVLFMCLMATLLAITSCESAEKNSPTSKPGDFETDQVLSNNPTETNALPPETEKQPIVYEYDELQSLFLAIGENTTVEDIEAAISEKNLFYSAAEYNKSSGGKSLNYVIAYTEGSAAQKYADPGDYLEVTFDKSKDNRIMYAHYVNASSVGYSALFYNYGVWYDFQEEQPGSYTGYYINDSFSRESGITITYSNGNSTNTNYFLYESGEAAINAVIDKIRAK